VLARYARVHPYSQLLRRQRQEDLEFAYSRDKGIKTLKNKNKDQAWWYMPLIPAIK
jgi:predicted GIY-YIG superfamily endonuclease